VTDRRREHGKNRMRFMHMQSMQPNNGRNVYSITNRIKTRSNVINSQPLPQSTVIHIPTKLHQFPTNSFRDFMRTDRQTDAETPPKTTPSRSRCAANNNIFITIADKTLRRTPVMQNSTYNRTYSIINQSINLLGNKGPKATYKSQYTIYNDYGSRQCIQYI